MSFCWLDKIYKEISKERVTQAKIESFAMKNKIEITADELKRVIETMVNNDVIQRQGEKESTTYNFPE